MGCMLIISPIRYLCDCSQVSRLQNNGCMSACTACAITLCKAMSLAQCYALLPRNEMTNH